MQVSIKKLTEETIGAIHTMYENNAGKELTITQQAEAYPLIRAYEAATGVSVPHGRAAFLEFCKKPAPDSLDHVQLVGSMLLGGKGGVTLYDEQGRAVRGLGKAESLAAAIRERSKITRQSSGENFASDGLTVGGYLRSMVTGPRNKVEMAALSVGSGGSGGYTVPEFLSAQIIDKFRARMVLTKLGALTIPMDGQTHTYAKLVTDPTPQWRQELVTINESEPTFGAITMTARSLAVIVRCSRELLQDSLNIEDAIERSLSAAFALEVDRVGMFGIGAAAEPMGIVNESGVNEVASVGTPTSYAKILDAYKLLLDDNAPQPTGLVMSPQEWRTFAGLVSATELQPLRKPPAIETLPFEATSGCTAGTMILGYFPDFAFGMRADLQIEVLKELYAASHEYGFVAHLRMDTGIFHPESFCKLTGVTA